MAPTYDENSNDLPESGELPPDDGDGGEQEGQDEGKTAAPTTPAPPPPEARSPLGKRKPGRPSRSGKRRGPPPASAAVGRDAIAEIKRQADNPSPPPVPRERVLTSEEVSAMMEKVDPRQESTQDIVERWPLVLEKLAQEGLGPEAVSLRVHAVADGAYAMNTGPAFLNSIDGRMVVGGGDLSPADALVLYIEQVFHMNFPRTSVKYMIDVVYKTAPPGVRRGQIQICRGYLTLQPYEMIVAQKRRAEDFARETARLAGSASTTVSLPRPGVGAPGPVGMPAMPAMPGMSGMPGAPYYPPPPPAGSSFSEEVMREMFTRFMEGKPIGYQPQPAPIAPPPSLYALPPPAAPVEPPPPPPTFKEQLKDFAEMMKILQGMQPPQAAAVVPAPAIGVGRAPREEAPRAPESLADQLKSAMTVFREFGKMRDELAGIAGVGGGDNEEEEEPKEDPPFKVAELPGGYKWPHGKGLSRLDQFQNFVMLNPDLSLKVVQGLSAILDRSAIRQLLEFMAQRGNPQQMAVAQQAMAAPGMAAPQVSQQALPPVMRPPSAPPPGPPNGAPPPVPPAPPLRRFTPVS